MTTTTNNNNKLPSHFSSTKKKSIGVGGKCRHPRSKPFSLKGTMEYPHNCTLGWSGINSGQNVEDAVIFERFFSGNSPLARLGLGNGHGGAGGEGGIFVEMGGLDGVTFSNTLLYENCVGWDGILIEAQPDNTKLLFENRPCPVVIPEGVCSVDDGDEYSTIRMSIGEGTAYDLATRGEDKEDGGGHGVEVLCRPLSAMLEEHGVTRINFFSLDVEGAELKVLETFDFDKVKIDVLIVEADFIENQQGGVHTDNSKVEAVRALIESKSDLKRVPSRLDQQDSNKRLCERNGRTGDDHYCLFLSIAGSDVFVSPELYEYDTKPWEYSG